MSNINLMVATGNVGRDMEVRTTKNGKSIGSFSVPVTQGWGDNKKTSWVVCKMFGERAEKLAPYVTKGTPVTVQGEFVLEEWEKDGVKRQTAVMIVNGLQLGKSGNSNDSAPAPVIKKPVQEASSIMLDDDIPF